MFVLLQCIPIPGLGFRRGSYKCVCRKGYYYPDTKNEYKFFNGSTLEEEYAKLMQVRKVIICVRDVQNDLILFVNKFLTLITKTNYVILNVTRTN